MLLLTAVALLSIVGGSVARISNAGDDTTENEEEKQREVACKSYDRVIAPKIAQNMNGNKAGYDEGIFNYFISGHLQFIPQDNSSHSDLQPVSISLCSSPGSSCLDCVPLGMVQQQIPDKVCQQEYREVVMLVVGDNGRDLVEDTFLMPHKCKCVTT